MSIALRNLDTATVPQAIPQFSPISSEQFGDWREMHASILQALSVIGDTPSEFNTASIHLACLHLRIALNIAIRMGGEN